MIQSFFIITLSFVLWAVIHSWLADFRLKARFRQRWGDALFRWYRLGYNFFAALSFVPVYLAYSLLPDKVLWQPGPLATWLMLGIQAVGLVGLTVAVFATDVGVYTGLAQLRPSYNPDAPPEPMRLSGLYCLVRHPIYFFSLFIVWFAAPVTVNRMVIATLFTLYFYYGGKHEELGLREEFGVQYDRYRQHVPMLVPRPGRKRCPEVLP
jgi:protein-S-isoprenylcysteine O-methyltransferase Ste14